MKKHLELLNERLAVHDLRLARTCEVGELFGSKLVHFSVVKTKPGASTTMASVILQDLGDEGYVMFGDKFSGTITGDAELIAGKEGEE